MLELPAKAIKALEEGIITTGHAQQILRAPEKNAEALAAYATTPMEWHKRLPTIDELKVYIDRHVSKDLASAAFPKDAPYAGEVACKNCAFNTENQNALFDGATKGSCTNPGCFQRKNSHFLKEMQAAGAAKFAGLKFLGAGTEMGYGSGPMHVKGAFVVEKVDEKIKKAMQANPDQFGYGIVKPSRWGGKKPRVVLLCKEAKLAGLAEPKAAPRTGSLLPKNANGRSSYDAMWKQPTTVLPSKSWSLTKKDLLALLREEWEDEWKRRRIMPLLEAADVSPEAPEGGNFPAEALEKKSRDAIDPTRALIVTQRQWR